MVERSQMFDRLYFANTGRVDADVKGSWLHFPASSGFLKVLCAIYKGELFGSIHDPFSFLLFGNCKKIPYFCLNKYLKQ